MKFCWNQSVSAFHANLCPWTPVLLTLNFHEEKIAWTVPSIVTVLHWELHWHELPTETAVSGSVVAGQLRDIRRSQPATQHLVLPLPATLPGAEPWPHEPSLLRQTHSLRVPGTAYSSTGHQVCAGTKPSGSLHWEICCWSHVDFLRSFHLNFSALFSCDSCCVEQWGRVSNLHWRQFFSRLERSCRNHYRESCFTLFACSILENWTEFPQALTVKIGTTCIRELQALGVLCISEENPKC